MRTTETDGMLLRGWSVRWLPCPSALPAVTHGPSADAGIVMLRPPTASTESQSVCFHRWPSQCCRERTSAEGSLDSR